MPNIERILVKEVNWLGDIVMSLPALRAVRTAHPQAHLCVLIRQELASFFDGAAWIDEVIPYQLRKGILPGWPTGARSSRRCASGISTLRCCFRTVSIRPSGRCWRAFRSARVLRAIRAGCCSATKPKRRRRFSKSTKFTTTCTCCAETLGISGSPDAFTPDVHAPSLEKMREFSGAAAQAARQAADRARRRRRLRSGQRMVRGKLRAAD